MIQFHTIAQNLEQWKIMIGFSFALSRHIVSLSLLQKWVGSDLEVAILEAEGRPPQDGPLGMKIIVS